MKASDFILSNQNLTNRVRKALDESTEDNFKENLVEALSIFGPDVVNNLDHLQFG